MSRKHLLIQTAAVAALLVASTSYAAIDVARQQVVNDTAIAPMLVAANKSGSDGTMMTADNREKSAVNRVSLENKMPEDRPLWDFVQVGFTFDMPKVTQDIDVYGFKVGLPMSGGPTSVTGIEMAFIAGATQNITGVQACTFASISKNLTGLQFSMVNYCEDVDGMQVGIANFAEKEASFQFGIFNSSKGSGFQLGLFNYIEGASVPFMMIFNYK